MLSLEEICAELNKKLSEEKYSPPQLREMAGNEKELEKIHKLLWTKLCELESQGKPLT